MAKLYIKSLESDWFSAWFNSESSLGSFSVSGFASYVSSSGDQSYSVAKNAWTLDPSYVQYSYGNQFIKWGGEFIYDGDLITGGTVTSFERNWGDFNPTGHIIIDEFSYSAASEPGAFWTLTIS